MSTRNKTTRLRSKADILVEQHKEECMLEETESWTIITALNNVLENARRSQLNKDFYDSCKSSLEFLRTKLGLNDIQIVILAIMVENGDTIRWRHISEYLALSRLSVMTFSDDMEDLVSKRWILHYYLPERGEHGFHLVHGVVNALCHNETFVPERIEGLSEQEFVEKLQKRITNHLNNPNFEFMYDEEWMLQLTAANAHLPLCKEVLSISNKHDQSLLLLTVADYAEWSGSEQEGLQLHTIQQVYEPEYAYRARILLTDQEHELMKRGLIEFKCEDGIVNHEEYVLTQKTKNGLLAGFTPITPVGMCQTSDRDLIHHEDIKEKPLFFNESEQQQIQRLSSLLSTDNLPSIQQRLEEQGMRKGFACLFYGAPGTGKTETVLQIARQTGRDLMKVDIAGLRDKFVGESEKNIKQVFDRYRNLCKRCEVMPILFFNEADAIFGKRSEIGGNSPEVQKMDNAMQNIILQEVENLDGILIATTNLTCNFDSAFERRFIYKVEFHKPDTEVKAKIWRSMLKDISADDARQLALHFDFSGGQIENIARKRTVDYILLGKYASFDELEDYCKAELLTDKNQRKQIAGFNRS